MRLLNSGTLNKGRNLWVTVAIDHLTVDGFHDELQPSAKKHQRRFDESVESMNFNWFVGMNINPFLFFWPFLKFHQFGSTVLPETLFEYVWYAGRESWKGILIVADLEQSDMMDASEFYYVKLNSKDMISPNLVTVSRNRRWTIKIYWRRSGPQNSNLDKVPPKFEEKFKKTFLQNQTGFHQPPKQEVSAQKHGLYRDQRYRHQNCFENVWENLSWTSSTSRLTPSITDKLLTCYRVYRQRLHCQTCLHLHLRHQRKILKVQYQIQHQSNLIVRIDKYGETRVATHPIKQCRRKRVSEQKLRIHDKYGKPLFFQ